MSELRRSSRLSRAKRSIDERDDVPEPPAKKVKPPKLVKKELKTVKKEQKTENKELEVGDEIPDVVLKNQDGKDVSLKEVCGKKKIVVIFAYPKASTPGCTRQACGFRDNYEDLKKHAAIFGLSADPIKSQMSFKTKQSLPYDLLSDPKRELIGVLGAKKTAVSGVIRSHWVFLDGKLKFKRVKVSPEVSISDAKEEVLGLVKDYEDGAGQQQVKEDSED